MMLAVGLTSRTASHDLADLLHGQGLAVLIAAGALDHHAVHLRVCGGRADGGIVRPAVGGQIHLGVVDAVELQGAEAVSADADGAAQGVIGRARDGQHLLAGLCQGEHGRTESMGAVDKADAHQRRLGAEDLGVDLIQGLPAQIVIAVAGGAGKAGVRDPGVLEGLHHPEGILLRHSVDLSKALAAALLRPRAISYLRG